MLKLKRPNIALSLLFIVLLPILVKLPALTGIYDQDPTLWLASVGDQAKLSNSMPWIDPNVGYTSQALGKLSADELLAGRMPWWNPYNGVGLPLTAEAQPGSLFVPFVFAYHFRDGVTWLSVLLQIIAGLFCFGFLRKIRLSVLAATTAAILYEFNGTLAWHAAPITAPIAFLPMLIYGVEQLFERVSQRRPGGWAIIPLALAWSLYAGFPEPAYISGLFVGLWVLFRLPDLAPDARLRFIGKLAMAVAIGMACSVLMVVPFAEYLTQAYIGGHEAAFAHVSLPKESLAVTLMPWLYGPIWAFNDPTNIIGVVWGNIGGFITALQLGVIFYAVLSRPGRLYYAPIIWIVLCLGKTYDVRPISDLMNILPMIKTAATFRYSPPSWLFASAILVAFVIDAIQRGNAGGRIKAAAALVVTATLSLASLKLAGKQVHFLLQYPPSARYVYVAVAWVVVSLIVALLILFLSAHRRRAAMALCVLLVLDATMAFALPIRSGARHPVFREDGVAYLQQHIGLQRTYSLGPMGPNYGAFFRVAQINHNYLPVTNNWVDYVRARLDPAANQMTFTGGINRAPGFGTAEDQLNARLEAYEELGVKYVLANPEQNPFAHSIHTHTDGAIFQSPMQLLGAPPLVVHWNLPSSPEPRTVSKVSVLIGTYGGEADGTVSVKICVQGGSCAQGSRSLKESSDNLPFELTLAEPLIIPPQSSSATALDLTFTQVDATHPVAFWLQALTPSYKDDVTLAGAPRPDAVPALSLILPETQERGIRRVYAGRDMSIYELADTKPYFEVTKGECQLTPISREQLDAACTTPATLLRREAIYPGWSARVDGHDTAVAASHEIFQAIEVAPGKHNIVFRYRPSHYGFILTGFALGMLALLLGFARELRWAWLARRVARSTR